MRWDRMSRVDIERLQSRRLRAFIREQVYPFSPHYHALFRRLGIARDDIRTIADLGRLPFLTKGDIAPTPADPERYKRIILQPDETSIRRYYPRRRMLRHILRGGRGALVAALSSEYRPVHLHFTTGRTSLPTPFVYSRRDLRNLREAGRRLFEVFGMDREDILVNAFPYAPHLAFWQTYHACSVVGLTSLHTGGGKVLGTSKIAQALGRMRATSLTAMPGYVCHLLRCAVAEDRRMDAMRLIILGGERVPPRLRGRVQDILSSLGAGEVRILSTYAFTESRVAWGECSPDGSGYHTYPDMEVIEVVDPKSGEPVEEGERGEIVYTALDWRGSCVLRYRTGDVTRGGLTFEACPVCSRTAPTLDTDITRSSEVKEFRLEKVKGSLIDMNAFFPMLTGYPGVEEWQVEIRKRNDDPCETDELVVYVSPEPGAERERLTRTLIRTIKGEFEVTPSVVLVDRDEMLRRLGMETEIKEKRILDARPG